MIDTIRALIRPVLTVAIVFSTLSLVWDGTEIPANLHQLNLIVLVFWFGERSVKNVLKAKQEGGNGGK
ncbi:MAG: hypothetical protein ACE5IR_16210 [bacterium]